MTTDALPAPRQRDPGTALLSRRIRATFAYAVLSLSAVFMLLAGVKFTRDGGTSYQTADWLINYGGGFVRRGLFGEIFLAVAPDGSLWGLFFVQSLLYLVLYAFAAMLLRRDDYSWSTIALTCGPAALGFFGWDENAGLRKEALVYVSLVLLVWAVSRSAKPRRFTVLALTSLATFALAVFSWEPSALLLPAVLYILLARTANPVGPKDPARWALATAFVAIGGTGLALSMVFRGDPSTARSICDAVRAHGYSHPDLCSGAIDAIGWTSEYTLQSVAASFPLYIGFLPLLALAAVPVVCSTWFRDNWKWSALIAISILPLFAIVTDYGRWISMIVMACLFCIAASGPRLSFSRYWAPLAAILYVILWGLPHWLQADHDGPWPWIGLTPSVINATIDLVQRLLG